MYRRIRNMAGTGLLAVLAACGSSSTPLAGSPASAICSALPAADNAANRPHTIPALREWHSAEGVFQEAEIAAGISPRLRILAQETWQSPPLTPRYAAFDEIAGG